MKNEEKQADTEKDVHTLLPVAYGCDCLCVCSRVCAFPQNFHSIQNLQFCVTVQTAAQFKRALP